MDSSDHNNPSKNNPSPNNQPKKGKGRQKLNMEKIENETNLQVTFSKRRAGLFKKASELSTLSGAESAVVVFSPGEKAHSFGHPNVETIANRFLNTNNAPPRNETDQLLTAQNEATMRQLNQELINVEGQLELERQRKKEHDSLRKASQSQNLCPPRIDELNYEQLDQLKRSIMSFKHDFETKVQNATSLANSYVQGTPNPEAGIEGGAPWTAPSGPNIGFPMGSNYMEGPSQFALYGNKAPLVPDGSTNPTPFHGGFVNPNVAIPTNPGSSASSVFPSSSVFVDPFGPNVGNFGFTVQYPHVAGASGSNVLLPYTTYGNPNDVVPYDVGTRSSNLEPEDSPMETQTDSE